MSLLRVGYRSLSSGKSSASVAAAVAKHDKAQPDTKLEVKKSVSGIHYVGLDVNKPIVDLIVMVDGAGSSSENYKNAGVSHALRLACGLSTKNFTPFGTIRNLQQFGTSLECTQTREGLIYSMKIHRDYFKDGFDFLKENVTCPSFKKWEVADTVAPAMKMEVANLNPLVRAQEELLRVAYRHGLGNSLFCPQRNIGAISHDMMREFHREHFTSENVVFGVSGVDFMTSRKLADTFHLPSKKGFSGSSSQFHVAESRIDTRDKNVCVVFGTDSQSHVSDPQSQEAVISDYLLSIILGKEISIKRGQGVGKLTQGLRSALGDAPFGVSSLYNEFKNNTLVGASLITEAASAGKAIDAVIATLRSLKITEQDVQGAKKRALYDVHSIMESSSNNLFEGVLLFAKTGDPNLSPWIDVLNQVGVSDLQASADRLAKAKFSMSSVGNLANVPYLDSLQK